MADWMDEWLEAYQSENQRVTDSYERLKYLDLVVLDNSVRESTVGQLKSHTADDKFKIVEEIEKCGFKEKIVGSFNGMTRVDDQFVTDMVLRTINNSDTEEAQETIKGFWGFVEVTYPLPRDQGTENGLLPDAESIPIDLEKMKKLGFFNGIFEIDLSDAAWDWDEFTVEDLCELMQKRFDWVMENCPWNDDEDDEEIGETSRQLKELYNGEKPPIRFSVNFRDMPESWKSEAGQLRIFQVVNFLTTLPEDYNIWALVYEDNEGNGLPEHIGVWAKSISDIIKRNESDAHLLVHIHERFGFCQSSVMQSLLNGANGLWAAVASEGAFLGQASTCVTIINLIKLGNTKVLEKYNCKYLRKAAIEVTRITTDKEPPNRQIVFGPRALDAVFALNEAGFNLADFFEERAPIRMSTMASAELIQEKLIQEFPAEEDFSDQICLEVCQAMREKILENLNDGVKQGYMSKAGISLLFRSCGGDPTPPMLDAIARQESNCPQEERLMAEAREKWDELDARERNDGQSDGMLQFDSFYNGFMAPFFGCYRCSDTKTAFAALDMDKDGDADWEEFRLFLKYAIEEYSDKIDTLENLIEITFTKCIKPMMRGLPTKF